MLLEWDTSYPHLACFTCLREVRASLKIQSGNARHLLLYHYGTVSVNENVSVPFVFTWYINWFCMWQEILSLLPCLISSLCLHPPPGHSLWIILTIIKSTTQWWTMLKMFSWNRWEHKPSAWGILMHQCWLNLPEYHDVVYTLGRMCLASHNIHHNIVYRVLAECYLFSFIIVSIQGYHIMSHNLFLTTKEREINFIASLHSMRAFHFFSD